MPADAQLLLLNKTQAESLLQPENTLKAVHDAFMRHSQKEGRLFPVIREKLSTGSVFGIKSGDIEPQSLLGFKAAGFWPDNRLQGKQAHQATIMLFDPQTGRPLCVMDANAITTMRTGAAGALGLTALAKPESTRLCVFGTGVQARIQLEFALQQIPTLCEIRYLTYNQRPDHTFEKYFAPFANRCVISHAIYANTCVANSDIVITATPGSGSLFDIQAVQPGTHINCVGADTAGKRELPAGLLEHVRLFVDDRAQAQEIGETQWRPDTPCTELGDLLTGKEQFVRQPEDITVFDMTGIALQDLTVAHMLYQLAQENHIGTYLDWPWQ